LSGSGLSDNSGKHNKVIGHKDVKQWRESSVSSTIAPNSGSSSDHKVKTSAKNKYNNKFDNNCNNSNHNKSNSSLKTISQSKCSQSKTSKTKTSTISKDKCQKTNGKRNNKLSKKDNILYDEDIIDGFAIFSFRNFHDLEV
jgi:hypothetical protein